MDRSAFSSLSPSVPGSVLPSDYVMLLRPGPHEGLYRAPISRFGLNSVLSANLTNATITPISTGLSIGLEAGRTYAFVSVLFVSYSPEDTGTDGYRVDFDGGGATAAAFRVFGTQHNGNGSVVATQGSNPPTTLAEDLLFTAASSQPDMLVFHGVIQVDTGGTFIPRLGKEADGESDTLTLYALSYLQAWDITP